MMQVQIFRHLTYDRMSRILRTDAQPSNAERFNSVSHRILLENGFINYASRGVFHMMPLIQRVLDKLCNLIDEEMANIGGQKLTLSSITDAKLWHSSGRWNSCSNELFKLKDRNNTEYCLGPTHEESIAEVVSRFCPLANAVLPLLLYQISWKYRDEAYPRYGLLRSREFLMKDMYSFDFNEASTLETYNIVSLSYSRIFSILNISPFRVEASVGKIGGKISHEYHLLCSAGEDQILYCNNCQSGINIEIVSGNEQSCKFCHGSLQKLRTTEIAHTFNLGDKYSAIFGATCGSSYSKNVLSMGCYGIGITRLLQALIDVSLLSKDEQHFFKWPVCIAPYKICVITPKRGSKEEHALSLGTNLVEDLSAEFRNDILLEDRDKLTIGKRINDAKRIGIPFIVIVGKRALESVPIFELVDLVVNNTFNLSHSELFNVLRSKI